MYVHVGSLYDPPHANGLAHFLEHMLFLGTKKYPQENSYSQYILKNGGQKNAATSEDYTYYYFDVKNEAFPGAVDIFSQFFKEPLFTEAATEREMQAVDSEYKKNLSDDGRAVFQFIKSIISKKGSPLNRFSTGGLETLNIPTIREDLLKFHAENYSSNLMSLVMVGRQDISELEELAITNFSDVPNKNAQLKDFSTSKVFDESNLGYIYKLVPKKNLKKLNIYWIMPYSEHMWRTKPDNYISHLLGHEGPNSLLSHLIKEGLAVSLSSSNQHRMRATDIMEVDIGLTEHGERNYKQVLKIVYSYINKIKAQGVQEYIFKEKQAKNLIDFDYKTKQSALSYSNVLGRRLLKVDDDEINDILWMPHAYEKYDPEEIQRRIDMLTPENSFVIFLSKTVEKVGVELNREKWYSSQYKTKKMNNELIQELSSILPNPETKLGYPPENKFIPKNLVQMKKERQNPDKPSFPQKISDEPLVWFKQDDSFEQPFVNCKLKFVTNDCCFPVTPLSQIFITLWKACLNEHLRELTYMAHLAGIDFGTGLALEYISCSVYGYNDGTAEFIKEVLKNIQNFEVSESFFNDMKESKIRAHENSLKQEPYVLQETKLNHIMLKYCYDVPDLLQALKEELTFSKFLEMKAKWLNNLKIEWLIMGHLTQEEAQNIVREGENSFQYNRIHDDDTYEQRLIKLPMRSVFDYEELNADEKIPNSCAVSLFQHSLKTHQTIAINSVLMHLLKEPFFNQLRTQEQLGYIVSSSPYVMKHVIHAKFLVQSSVKGADYLVHRINEFMKMMKEKNIANLTDEMVEETKKAIINNLMQQDLTLGQEVSRYWSEIVDGEYEFDKRDKRIEATRLVTKQQVVDYFDELFFSNPKRINIKLYSHNHHKDKDENDSFKELNTQFYHDHCKESKQELIQNVKAFKLHHSQFPRL